MSVTVIATEPNIPSQNNLLHNNNNNSNNNNNNKENNNIDTGTIPVPNTAKLVAKSGYESKTAAELQQYHHSIMGVLPVNENINPDYDETFHTKLLLYQKHKVGVLVLKFDELNRMILTDLPG